MPLSNQRVLRSAKCVPLSVRGRGSGGAENARYANRETAPNVSYRLSTSFESTRTMPQWWTILAASVNAEQPFEFRNSPTKKCKRCLLRGDNYFCRTR